MVGRSEDGLNDPAGPPLARARTPIPLLALRHTPLLVPVRPLNARLFVRSTPACLGVRPRVWASARARACSCVFVCARVWARMLGYPLVRSRSPVLALGRVHGGVCTWSRVRGRGDAPVRL